MYGNSRHRINFHYVNIKCRCNHRTPMMKPTMPMAWRAPAQRTSNTVFLRTIILYPAKIRKLKGSLSVRSSFILATHPLFAVIECQSLAAEVGWSITPRKTISHRHRRHHHLRATPSPLLRSYYTYNIFSVTLSLLLSYTDSANDYYAHENNNNVD